MSVAYRRVDRVAKILAAGVHQRRQVLLHQYTDQLLGRVDPAVGVGHAAPAEIAARSRRRGLRRIDVDAVAEAESVAY